MNRELKFEEAIDKLSEINKKMESGDISLEESIKLYKEGIELTKLCQDKLSEARKQLDGAEKE